MSKKFIFLFVAILVLAAFLRLYRLNSIPPGVNQDEASIGYTAYSILHTGRDEYGRLFPLSFQSFGDWKLPVYIYSVVPFVSLLGLSELAVRLPSALVGIISVGLTFFLVRLLFKNNLLAFLTMFLIAIAPWHLHLSRVESESNTAVLFIILGMICFLKSLKAKHWLIIPSAFFFALTYFTYAGNHVFTTLLVLGLLFIYRSEIKITKISIIAAVIFLGMSSFIFSQTLFGADATKISGIGIFGDPSVVHAQIELPRLEHNNPNSFFARLTHNRVVFGLERFGQNYMNAFSGQFLFVSGGTNKAHNIANFGNMYLVEAPFLFLGLIYLIVLKKGKEKYLVVLWFFIAPIAASITKDAPHTNRMFAIFPILPLVVAFGLSWAVTEIIDKPWRKLAVVIIAIFFLLNVAIYIDRYYAHFPRDEAQNWGLGYKELNLLLSKPEFSSQKVIMARPQYEPYVYLLFYSIYNPSLYQKQAVRYPPTEDKFVHVKSFGRYEFRPIDWGKDLGLPNTFLVDWSTNIPSSLTSGYKQKFEVSLPNSQQMFTVIETQ
ncbi:MAG: glycosyltransferase family 39 protein [Candidatus Levybacteria bacterium]|nr:glycosyltransferase family 39 protein [Candidatus Levybacteria bacterium]